MLSQLKSRAMPWTANVETQHQTTAVKSMPSRLSNRLCPGLRLPARAPQHNRPMDLHLSPLRCKLQVISSSKNISPQPMVSGYPQKPDRYDMTRRLVDFPRETTLRAASQEAAPE